MRRLTTPLSVRLIAGLGLSVILAAVAVHAQEQATLYLFAVDQKGVPVLDLTASDITIKEDLGASTIRSVRRFGWPMKVTVLLDNGPRTADALVHYRTGLRKFFAGLPPGIPVSLVATSPQPRWLFRETTDKVQIEKGIGLITIDETLGRFSDALGEYAARLDTDFRNVSIEQMPPYLPVLVSIATTDQDGSDVRRESNLKMILSLRKHLAWTNMIMISPAMAGGGVLSTDPDVGQNAEIAKVVQEATRGAYTPVTGSGTSALSSTLLPELAQAIARRHIRQMTQHRIVLERPAGAKGPMKNFALTLSNHPGAQIVVSTDGNIP
jgi:hypothetical protein